MTKQQAPDPEPIKITAKGSRAAASATRKSSTSSRRVPTGASPIKNRVKSSATSSVKPSVKSSATAQAKSSARTATGRPSARKISLNGSPAPERPMTRGRFIDFKPRTPRPAAHKTTPKPVHVVVATPVVEVEPELDAGLDLPTTSPRPALNRESIASPRPAMRPATPVTHKHTYTEKTETTETTVGYQEQLVGYSEPPIDYQESPDDDLESLLDDFIEEDIGEKNEPSPEETFTSAPEPFASASRTPTPVSGALAPETASPSPKPAKSPFIPSVNVDKRPLSARRIVPDDEYSSSAPDSIHEEDFHGNIHNIYTKKQEKEEEDAPTIVSPSPKSSSGTSIAFIIAIMLTVILGAAVGSLIFFAFFQH